MHEETVKIVDAQVMQMAIQMAALDEFVTRARTQNDGHHTDRMQTLEIVVNRARDRFAVLEKDSHASMATIVAIAEEQKQQGANLDKLVGSFQGDTQWPLQNLKADLSGATLADYIPTGQTPQKRDWSYPTQLPRTENHEAIVAKLRGLPDPSLIAKTPSSTRSPKKQASPRKAPASPSKIPSPSKTKVFTDIEMPKAPVFSSSYAHTQTAVTSIPLNDAKAGLREVDINVANSTRLPASSHSAPSSVSEEKSVLLDFSKSVGSGSHQPPLKRHATANAVVDSRLPTAKLTRSRSTVAAIGSENFSQSVGVLGGGRKLRSSPPQ